MSQKNSVRRSAIILVLAIAYFVSTILFEGKIENYLNPPKEHIFDPLADSANWEEYKIPEINMSFKLPPNTKVYTRESVAKGSVASDENFEWAVGRFESPERYFVATNYEYDFNLLISVFSRNYSIFRDDYNKFTSKQLRTLITSNYDYGSLKSYHFFCNGNTFVYSLEIHEEYMGTKHLYDTLIKNKRILSGFLYDTKVLTDTQQSVQNAIIKSVSIN